MANIRLDGVMQHVRKLVTAKRAGVPTDGELLERFVCRRDEDAFTTLVQRHGAMVLGVCRRLLKDGHDAEDACQAAFLVLARRAGSIRKRESVGSWLYGVAYRASANVRRRVARCRGREVPAVEIAEPPPPDVCWHEVRTVIDDELQRLPERFRAPLLLCYFEGRTRDEAAQELGWSLGTFRGRLERGRDLLRVRLKRRGVGLSAALMAGLLTGRATSTAVPASFVARIVRAATRGADQALATGAPSVRAATVAEGVIRAMLLTRVKIVLGLLLALGLLGLGAGHLTSKAVSAWRPENQGADNTTTSHEQKEQPTDPPTARNAAESRDNLKQLALAMHKYADANAFLPAPASYASERLSRVGWMMGSAMGAGGAEGGGLSPISPGGAGGNKFGGSLQTGAEGGARSGGMAGAMAAQAQGTHAMMQKGASPKFAGIGVGSKFGGGPIGGTGGRKDGKALLSWRVAILPYLGEEVLYKQFKLDEAWDSPHNKRLLEKMPKVYAPPGIKTREPYTTFYQVFVGGGAIFEKHAQAAFPASIPDGTSNTILIAEAGSAVPWTKPEDMHYAPDEPLPELGGLYPNIFNVALADGSAVALLKRADPDVLRAAITRAGGEVVDLDKIKAPASPRAARLHEENLRLQEELAKERAHLDSLQREQRVLTEEDADSERLRKENDELEKLIHETRDQSMQLQHEIERLRRALGKQSQHRKP
jgi:RNA polymerase sigma factor (sigma-70 family)